MIDDLRAQLKLAYDRGSAAREHQDLSANMVERCRDKGLDAHVMDVANVSFVDKSFDAVYSFNCLLHLPKDELRSVLLEIRRVLALGDLCYFGTWGGFDHEGVYQEDDHDPQRFFSFYDDEHLKLVVGKSFDMLNFRSLNVDGHDPKFRFQSLLLQKPHYL